MHKRIKTNGLYQNDEYDIQYLDPDLAATFQCSICLGIMNEATNTCAGSKQLSISFQFHI